VFPLDQIADVVALRSEDPKLITRLIIFEQTQHIRQRYINVADGRTERQMDGRLTIAILLGAYARTAGLRAYAPTSTQHKTTALGKPDADLFIVRTDTTYQPDSQPK